MERKRRWYRHAEKLNTEGAGIEVLMSDGPTDDIQPPKVKPMVQKLILTELRILYTTLIGQLASKFDCDIRDLLSLS